MDTNGRAVHINTGDRNAARMIDEWLAQHNLEVIRGRDAFEAVVAMLTQAASSPELAFVGMDYLDGHDQAVLRYLRETWPHIAIVAYGPPPGDAAALRVCTCESPQALRELLATGPRAVIGRFSGSGTAPVPPGGVPASAERSAVIHPGLMGDRPDGGGIVSEPDATLSADELNKLLDQEAEPPSQGIL